jgi:hypothetical protein
MFHPHANQNQFPAARNPARHRRLSIRNRRAAYTAAFAPVLEALMPAQHSLNLNVETTGYSGPLPYRGPMGDPGPYPTFTPAGNRGPAIIPEPSALTPSGMVIISSSVDAANRCYICGECGHSYVSCPSYCCPFCYHLIPGHSPGCPAVPFLETTTLDADEQGFRMVEAGASTLEGG